MGDVLVKLFQQGAMHNDLPMVCDGPCCRHQGRHHRRYETRQSRVQQNTSGKLPKDVTRILNIWLYAHARYPYPSTAEKHCIMRQTGLTIVQINNWFSNARRRKLRPSSHYTRDKHITYKRAAFHGTL